MEIQKNVNNEWVYEDITKTLNMDYNWKIINDQGKEPHNTPSDKYLETVWMIKGGNTKIARFQDCCH